MFLKQNIRIAIRYNENLNTKQHATLLYHNKKERSAMNFFSPAEVASNYIATGKSKVNLPAIKMLLLGIMAGAFIAFGGIFPVIGQPDYQS